MVSSFREILCCLCSAMLILPYYDYFSFSTRRSYKTIQKYNQQSNNNLLSTILYSRLLYLKEESRSGRKWFNVFMRVLLFFREEILRRSQFLSAKWNSREPELLYRKIFTPSVSLLKSNPAKRSYLYTTHTDTSYYMGRDREI